MRYSTLVALSCVLLSLGFLTTPAGYADVLTIVGDARLAATRSGPSIQISGSYEMGNRGDERALAVFPEFTLEQEVWSENHVNLEPKQSYIWQIDKSITPTKIETSEKDLSAGLELPEMGIFPLLVLHDYSDANMYRFSAAQVVHLGVGPIPGKRFSAMQAPVLKASLSVARRGDEFSGVVDIENTSSEDLRVAVAYYTSADLKILSSPEVVELEANARASTKLRVRNSRGLPGSQYAVFAVLQWQDGEFRNSLSSSGRVTVFEQRDSGAERMQRQMFTLLVLLIVIPSLLLVFLILRVRRKS